MTRRRRQLFSAGTALALASAAAPAAPAGDDAAPAPAGENPTQRVEIIGTTPLPGSGVALSKTPANVQTFDAALLRRRSASSLTDFLEAHANGVTVNAAQGNPNQPDVNVRGFTASPLIGTPQGVSVFVDGVRVNEPFGDSVNWDLILLAAIAAVQLVPGSNPGYGLNTLGAALAITTHSGASAYPDRPGAALTLSAGSFGRQAIDVQAGGRSAPARGRWDWFVAGHDGRDRGWAEHNPSRVRQAYAKLGWRDDAGELQLALNGADNRLGGAQTLPLSFADPRQSYTWPDNNSHRLAALQLQGRRQLAGDWEVAASAHLRRFASRNVSSNANDEFGAGDEVEAVNEASAIDQHSAGVSVQFSGRFFAAGMAHRLAVGASVDAGRAHYTRQSQDAEFNADRGTRPLAGFVLRTDTDSTTRHRGAYVADSVEIDPRWTLTLAARLNRADVSIADRSGVAPLLDGSHRHARLNPALGLNFNPRPGFTAYAGINQGMRAPTATELACADPDAPCKLPNNFVADPPLRKVVSQTIEFGARGRDDSLRWSVALFRTSLRDDLQFVSSNAVAVNAGYFRNVGGSRRQGVELALQRDFGALRVQAQYSLLDAEYRSDFLNHSPANSSADGNGAIAVRRGDRIPGLPRQTLKLGVEARAGDAASIGATLVAASSIVARGDENQRDVNGRIPGHSVVNVDARARVAAGLAVFARVDNASGRRYSNFGLLGRNVFTGPAGSFDGGHARAEQFRSHGAPRSVTVGVERTFD